MVVVPVVVEDWRWRSWYWCCRNQWRFCNSWPAPLPPSILPICEKWLLSLVTHQLATWEMGKALIILAQLPFLSVSWVKPSITCRQVLKQLYAHRHFTHHNNFGPNSVQTWWWELWHNRSLSLGQESLKNGDLFIGFASFVWFLAPTLFFCSASFVPLSSFVAFFLDQHCHCRSIINDEGKRGSIGCVFIEWFPAFYCKDSLHPFSLFDLAKFMYTTTAADDTWQDVPRGIPHICHFFYTGKIFG